MQHMIFSFPSTKNIEFFELQLVKIYIGTHVLDAICKEIVLDFFWCTLNAIALPLGSDNRNKDIISRILKHFLKSSTLKVHGF